MRAVLTRIDEGHNATDMACCVSVLDACQWVASASAWKETNTSTVAKCFTMSGFPAAVANILQANTISLDLHEPMLADEYVMIDDD